jgi:hypothetical protein
VRASSRKEFIHMIARAAKGRSHTLVIRRGEQVQSLRISSGPLGVTIYLILKGGE